VAWGDLRATQLFYEGDDVIGGGIIQREINK
jgi:hypothetical protein